ncbi:heparinase II/III family protein [Paenibacillus cymbidii]|uniref:heparinase II/III family protein n=1 Tax=Paenibacillus cymbidii TaxID=1639034 RepID=UPI0010812631|nr:heparinase II/III family protein [Paenibacillus cymbidii]
MNAIGLTELTLKQLKRVLEETPAWTGTEHLFPETARVGALRESDGNGLVNEAFWSELKERGERFAETPIVQLPLAEFWAFGRTGDRGRFEHAYFERRRKLSVYAMLQLTEGEGGDRWLTALEEVIWAICDEYTWVLPAHVGLYVIEYPNGIWDKPAPPRETVDLFAGETAFALAEIMRLFEQRLHPWVVHRVKEEIERRIFRVYFDDPTPQNWEMKTNNWPAVCAASSACAAIYLVDDAEKLAGMIWRALHALRAHISGFDEQGATPEGVAYWQFGFGYYVFFAELLRARTEGRVDLLQGEHVGSIARFPQACLLTGSQVVNFSDSPSVVDLSVGLFARLRDRCGGVSLPEAEAGFGDAQLRCWAAFSRSVLWALTGETAEPAAEPQEDFHFRGNQWVVSKRRLGGGPVVFAAKGGHNEEPHNHNDLGHFVLHTQGGSVLKDIGMGEYTRQYFQTGIRYGLWTAGSHGHSVPVVDGVRQSYGSAFRTETLAYEAGPDGGLFRLDLTRAYECEHLQSLHRTFEWAWAEEELTLTVTDEAAFARAPESFEEAFIADAEPVCETPGTVRIGPVTLAYDAAAWSYAAEQLVARVHGGADGAFWRIALRAIQPEAKLAGRFTFRTR